MIPPRDVAIPDYVQLFKNGYIEIAAGYSWDGPSGPTIDTHDFMRGSLVHDAFYQLIREGELPLQYRFIADKLLLRHCLEDGMSKFRATYVYCAVHLFGWIAVKKYKRFSKTHTAPKL